ncbi:GAF domain-containing sensor histidine kinase [candidate division KSB1 bacterium]|nr:GAF domain-containing sensor histidine kinase [candidate division KSB1 bacterium]
MITKLEREQMERAPWASEPRCRDFVEQITQGDITARKRAERLTRALQALTAVNQTLIRATGEQTLLSEVCRAICEVGGYRMAWVGYKEDDPHQTLRPRAWWGYEDGYLNRVKISWGDNEFGQGPASLAIRTSRPAVLRNTQTDIRISQWQEAATQRGYASILGAPLLAEGKPFGSLTIYSAKADAFDREEMALLQQMADDLAFGIVSLRARAERNRAEKELKFSREQLRNLAAHLQSAREAERTHLAREIHDELGQYLTGLKMDVASLEELINQPRAEDERSSLLHKVHAMSQLLDTTVQSVRKIASELRPAVLDSLGLLAAIEWQAEEFQRRTGIRCESFLTAEKVKLDRDGATAVFRILQESLTNIMRHANANRVTITFEQETGHYLMEIKDDGEGIQANDLDKSSSLGVLGMKERAHLFGGSVSIHGEPGKGTTVVVKIPLQFQGAFT